MENKLNIAEILKDCPKGMELDSPLFDDVHFDFIDDVCDIINCYIQDSTNKIGISFSKYGCYSNISKSKCVIFPKGKTTWEGFQRPFKDGDILISGLEDNPFIFKRINRLGNAQCYCAISCFGQLILNDDNWTYIKGCRLATEEEKQKLFDAIKANGYKWNHETKTLEKLIEPKFKVGDRIKYRSGEIVYRIVQITEDSYVLDNLCSIPISIEHMYNLVPNKFDINTLVPFESRVLVRDANCYEWEADIFGRYSDGYITLGGGKWKQCIPYKGNEHLLGTANDCDNYYKNWE